MKPSNVFMSNTGQMFHNQLDAVLTDIKFDMQECINDFSRPFPVTSEGVVTVLRWLYNNRDREELSSYLELLK